MTRTVSRRSVLRAGAGAASVWLAGLPVAGLARALPPARASRFRAEPAEVASPDDLAYLTIAQASAMIAAGSVSPLELVDACLACIERHDGSIKAWVSVFAEDARAAARAAAAEIARSGPRSPLHGIPLGIKDIYDIEGVPTKCGSRVRQNTPPAGRDATMVERLRDAGAIFLGKTTTHEFATGGVTPPTSNPWDVSRIPGGSSGGSAASLASGMCLGANGSDTAGSIRMPAALCGVVGLKPTYGRVSRAGVFQAAASLDHMGPLARSVEDCALLMNAIAGPDPRDPTTVAAAVADFTSRLGTSIAGRRIGVPTSIFFDGADPEVVRAVDAAISVFRSLGATVVPLEVPDTQPLAFTSWFLISTSEALSVHESTIRRRPLDYEPSTAAILQLGQPWPATYYQRAQRIRTINILEWMDVFEGIGAVLSPTTPRPAPTKTEGQVTGVFDLIKYSSQFDLAGFPSISVPAGFTRAGLPVGLMLTARPFDEVGLLQIAHAYQQATRIAEQRPPLS